jgi:hypothetical protein
MAPLQVVFHVSPGVATTIARVEVDMEGNGSFDQVFTAEPWSASVTYSGSGTISPVVRVTDAQGMVRTEAIPIVLVDPAVVDQYLRTVWSGMSTALAAGDKAAAMRYLDAFAQQKYGPVFDALLPNMLQIVGSFSALQS